MKYGLSDLLTVTQSTESGSLNFDCKTFKNLAGLYQSELSGDHWLKKQLNTTSMFLKELANNLILEFKGCAAVTLLKVIH